MNDGSAVLRNKVPFLEISYPIPHVLNHQQDHETLTTITDQPQQGLNFYDEIVKVGVGSNLKGERPNADEVNELLRILKGGVILNVYPS